MVLSQSHKSALSELKSDAKTTAIATSMLFAGATIAVVLQSFTPVPEIAIQAFLVVNVAFAFAYTIWDIGLDRPQVLGRQSFIRP